MDITLNGYVIKDAGVDGRFYQFLQDNLKGFVPGSKEQFNACINDLLEQDAVYGGVDTGTYELEHYETVSHNVEEIYYSRHDIEDEDGNFTTIIEF